MANVQGLKRRLERLAGRCFRDVTALNLVPRRWKCELGMPRSGGMVRGQQERNLVP